MSIATSRLPAVAGRQLSREAMRDAANWRHRQLTQCCAGVSIDWPTFTSIDLIVSAESGNQQFRQRHVGRAFKATCFRVAKPGGCLALTTNLVGHMQGFADVYRESLRACDLDHLERALDRHVGHRATDTSLKAMLHDAGFVDVNLHTDQFALRFANGTALLNHSFMRVGFMPAWKALVPEPQHACSSRTLEQRLERVWPNGTAIWVLTCQWPVSPAFLACSDARYAANERCKVAVASAAPCRCHSNDKAHR